MPGIGAAASFKDPEDVDVSLDMSFALAADHTNNKIRRIELVAGEVTTMAGSGYKASTDGLGAAASFDAPGGVSVSYDVTFALVVDKEAKKYGGPTWRLAR